MTLDRVKIVREPLGQGMVPLGYVRVHELYAKTQIAEKYGDHDKQDNHGTPYGLPAGAGWLVTCDHGSTPPVFTRGRSCIPGAARQGGPMVSTLRCTANRLTRPITAGQIMPNLSRSI